jgi:hypothetical protein
MNINEILTELKELQTFNIDIGSDCDLYVERNVDGPWVSLYDIETLIQKIESKLEKNNG